MTPTDSETTATERARLAINRELALSDGTIDSLFPVVAVSHLSGSRWLLRRWKKESGEYHTVIFARQDSSITRLEDLEGKMIAFEEPFSTTGYFLPKQVLTQAGLRVVPKSEAADPVSPDEVGYVFSDTDESPAKYRGVGVEARGFGRGDG